MLKFLEKIINFLRTKIVGKSKRWLPSKMDASADTRKPTQPTGGEEPKPQQEETITEQKPEE